MNTLPLDLLVMIGREFELFRDWLEFALINKRTYKCLSERNSRPEVDIHLINWITGKPDDLSLMWRGKYTRGVSWCRGTSVLLNDITGCKYYKCRMNGDATFTVLEEVNYGEDGANDYCRDNIRFESPEKAFPKKYILKCGEVFNFNNGTIFGVAITINFPSLDIISKVKAELEYVQEVGESNYIEFRHV